MTSEILYLLDSDQGLFMPQGDTSRGVIGKPYNPLTLHEEIAKILDGQSEAQ